MTAYSGFLRGNLKRVAWAVFSGLLFLWASVFFAEASPQTYSHILFISSHHPGYPPFYRQVEGVLSVLESRDTHLDIEFMDSKRFDPKVIEAPFHKLLSYKMAHLPAYDLVLAGDDNALRYVLAHQEGLFKNIPVVFLGVSNRNLALDQNGNPHVTGAIESVAMAETLTLVTQLQPDVQRIVAISDGTASARGLLDRFYAVSRDFKPIQFSNLSLKNLSFDELSEVLKTFDKRDAVLLLSAFVDSTGRRFPFGASLKRVTDHLGAPLYHLWYHGMGAGVIGGKLISAFDQGQVAAKIASEILSGRPVYEIPVEEDSRYRFLVDPKAMRDRGLSLSLIPGGVGRFQEDVQEVGTYGVYARLTLWGIGVFSFLICVMAVITFHRRRADEQVARSELRFRRLTRHMQEVFCVGSMESLQIHEVTPAVENILGMSPAKIRRNPELIVEAVHEADRESVFAYLAQIQSGQENLAAIEFRMRDVKGQLRWVRFQGFSIQQAGSGDVEIAGMATEITDAKQEDIAMKALVETLASRVEQDFFDGAVRQLCSFLDCNLAIIGELKNDTMVQTLAMVQDGCIDSFMDYPLSGTPCFETMSEGVCIYAEGVQSYFPSNLMLKKVGAEGYLGFPLRDRHGKVIGIMSAVSRKRFSIPKHTQEVVAILAQGIANEMERLKNEREKKEMEISLIRSQKMQAMGTLAGGIAHDFNNMLFPIMGYVQMMQEETLPESPHGRYLSKIHASSLRAKKLVDQILAFSRKGDQVFEPVTVPDVLREVLDLVRASLPATVDMKMDIADDILPVMGDATQIHQVVMNLVTNAFHAMEGRGGCIWVRLASSERPATEGAGGVAPGLCLTIRDSGCGIDPSVMNCIFDPYFTTKPKEKGTGLGLAVVHGIVDNHGGEIDVQSTPGVGTTFTVTLPGLKAASIRNTPQEKVPMPTGHEHILVVDDEEEVGVVEQMMLERLGYRVSVASSGPEALELLATEPTVHLMLTDMTMPQMTGLQLVARVRETGLSFPVLLCTGLKDASQERSAKGLGIVGIVKKPVSMDELATQVRGALDTSG
ncbi:ABC transporter substrate binding protein [Desulfoluna sp.]|uniref:ABC transporter substrate binding protein n=1 Tax=Desulfoluna sp. TaxID=2045199 RepID=UPI0026344592|nr:ABC transporter substrate binding protein [Desulfoluna sp.]